LWQPRNFTPRILYYFYVALHDNGTQKGALTNQDDFDGGNGGNKNSLNNGNKGSGSGKNPKSSLRDGLVGWRQLHYCQKTAKPIDFA